MFNIDFREIITVGMAFAVIDIVGTIPIIVDLRSKHGHIESEKASIVAGIIMIVFLLWRRIIELNRIDVNFCRCWFFVSFGTRNDFRYSYLP
jgi:multiple antibiotic resistance protein